MPIPLVSKKCGDCGEIKPVSEFYRSNVNRDGERLSSRCRVCFLIDTRARAQNRRRLCLDYYGPNCRCCGESETAFLVLDHIDGGGRAHRQQEGVGNKLHLWIIRNGFPEGFQTLCANCNMAKEWREGCPHQEAKT